jgi:hypothetical protein
MKRVRLEDKAVTKHKSGPASEYDPKHYPRYAKFLAEHGATQDEIADCFGGSTRTLLRWLAEHPELREAVRVGVEVFNPRVERGMAERAMGFYADNFAWRATTEAERKAGKPEYVLVPTSRVYYPPDPTAGRYFLNNRMRDKWADINKVEVSDVNKVEVAVKRCGALQPILPERITTYFYSPAEITPLAAITPCRNLHS